jgi:hypothetical protein
MSEKQDERLLYLLRALGNGLIAAGLHRRVKHGNK